jgi:hypothetical protein
MMFDKQVLQFASLATNFVVNACSQQHAKRSACSDDATGNQKRHRKRLGCTQCVFRSPRAIGRPPLIKFRSLRSRLADS